MDTADVQIGSTITNGHSAIRVTERRKRDALWRAPSWAGISIPTEVFGSNPGTMTSVPDYLLGSWKDVPFEWQPVTGGRVEERFVWTADWKRLQREVRPIMVPVDCRAEHGQGHPDCPKCWRWSDRNPNREPRPVAQ